MITKETQSKHWVDKNLNTIQSYWDSPPATKRSKWFAEHLKNHDFKSIFEIGYFSGRNLKYIYDKFGDAIHIGGLEINPKAVRFARKKMNLPNLLCMDLHDMANIDEKFDIVFTSGVLIHIVPSDLNTVLTDIISKTNKYIMHIEQHGDDVLWAGPKSMNPLYKVSSQYQWNCNLLDRYREIGYEPEVIKLPEEVKTNGASELTVVRL